MTDRKPALKRYDTWVNEHESEVRSGVEPDGSWVLASDIPFAILNATKEELAALAVFAEAMPEIIGKKGFSISMFFDLRVKAYDAALAVAKEAEP